MTVTAPVNTGAVVFLRKSLLPREKAFLRNRYALLLLGDTPSGTGVAGATSL